MLYIVNGPSFTRSGLFKRATAVSDIILAVVAVVIAGFAAAFGLLIWTAIDAANAAGITGMFTSYGYITIEAVYLMLIVVGAYFVFQVGLRHGVPYDENEEEDLMDVSG